MLFRSLHGQVESDWRRGGGLNASQVGTGRVGIGSRHGARHSGGRKKSRPVDNLAATLEKDFIEHVRDIRFIEIDRLIIPSDTRIIFTSLIKNGIAEENG